MAYLDQIRGAVPTLLWVHEGDTVISESGLTVREWRRLLRLASRIAFCSRWQAEEIFKTFLYGIDARRIVVVPLGLPSISLGDLPDIPKHEGKKRIVFVGGVYPRKRPQDLAEAVCGMSRSDIECVFVGAIEEMNTLGDRTVALLNSNPARLKCVGERSRLETLGYMRSADVYCSPSGDEAFSLANLEAAWLGVPCALSDLPPYRDIWRHEENCLLHEPGDVVGLRTNIEKLLDGSHWRQAITANARALAERYSMPNFLDRFTRQAVDCVSLPRIDSGLSVGERKQ